MLALCTQKENAISDISTKIIEAVRQGDQKAFRQLFDSFYKEMVLSARYLLKDHLLAEEAAQEAFVALWNNREALDSSKSVRSYLKTATINRSLNILKSRRLHMGEGPEPLVTQISQYDDPQKIQENQELGQKIKLAVDNLPDRCREIFVLSKYEGKSHKEIAALLDISTKTVENQMTNALKKLRDQLKPYVRTGVFFILFIFEWGKTLLGL